MASAVGRVCRAFLVYATSPYPSIIRSVRDRLGTCLPDNMASSVMVLGLACRISRSNARLTSDKTAASVAIEGNQTVGSCLPEAVTSGASVGRILTTQRFMANGSGLTENCIPSYQSGTTMTID